MSTENRKTEERITEKKKHREPCGIKTAVTRAARVVLLFLFCVFIGCCLYSLNAEKLLGNPLPMPFGYGIAAVMSGSMEPALRVGDLVIVKEKASGETYEAGEIAVYSDGKFPVIHRVIGRDEEGRYLFRGDANNVADRPVADSRVLGKLAVCIPKAGNIVFGLKKPVCMWIMFLLAVLIIVLPEPAQKPEDDEIRSMRKEIEKLRKERKR